VIPAPISCPISRLLSPILALLEKDPTADREWIWQYIFPSHTLSQDPRSSETRRHHLHESTIQKALKQAVQRSGVPKRVSCHTHVLARGGRGVRSRSIKPAFRRLTQGTGQYICTI
jgi:integrase